MEALLAISDRINAIVQRIAYASGWLFLVATVIIIFDVLSRKFGFQIPGFGSTRLQELEWHVHTALFSFWLGMGYIRNTHVRVDVAASNARIIWWSIAGPITRPPCSGELEGPLMSLPVIGSLTR